MRSAIEECRGLIKNSPPTAGKYQKAQGEDKGSSRGVTHSSLCWWDRHCLVWNSFWTQEFRFSLWRSRKTNNWPHEPTWRPPPAGDVTRRALSWEEVEGGEEEEEEAEALLNLQWVNERTNTGWMSDGVVPPSHTDRSGIITASVCHSSSAQI